MKKYFPSIIGLMFLSLIVVSSCEKDETCIDCAVEQLIARDYVIDTATGATIKMYPVMTPSNHPMCDSMAYSPIMGAYVYPHLVHKDYQKLCTVDEARDSLLAGNDTACPCRENPDTAYNDSKNSFLRIGNIEKYPYNRLFIKTTADTTKMRVYTDYDNKNNLFIGEVAMDMSLRYYEYNNTKPLASGVYGYMLVLYKDKDHYDQLGDTLKGNFAIIRSNRDNNRNCATEAYDADDPLLN